MPTQTRSPRFHPSTINFQLFRANSFRLIQFRKNASATPLVSHTFKTKDLKPFRFTHFQKKGGGAPDSVAQPPLAAQPIPSNIQPRTSNLRSSLSPLHPTLTKNIPRGRGAPTEFRISSFELRRRSRAGDAFSIRGILLYSTGTIHPCFFYTFGGERAQCLQTASRSSSRDRN